MKRVVDRAFTVRAPLSAAWDHLANVQRWPSWARHIVSVELSPEGPLTANSRGSFKLSNGVRSTFEMTGFEPGRRWKWTGPFLTSRVHYDHIFAAVAPERTEIRFIVEAEGGLTWLLGGLFGVIYRRNLAKAIPRLIVEIEQSGSALPRS